MSKSFSNTISTVHYLARIQTSWALKLYRIQPANGIIKARVIGSGIEQLLVVGCEENALHYHCNIP